MLALTQYSLYKHGHSMLPDHNKIHTLKLGLNFSTKKARNELSKQSGMFFCKINPSNISTIINKK